MRWQTALIPAVFVFAAACNLFIGLERGVPDGTGGSSSASATSSTGSSGGTSASSSVASTGVASTGVASTGVASTGAASSSGGCIADDAGSVGCDRSWAHWPVTKPTTFTVMDVDAVLDGTTGLIWQQAIGPQMTWQDAVDYCSALQLAGRCDFRLPTRIELATLVDYTVKQTSGPLIDAAFSAAASEYWTASPFAGDATEAWYVHFGSGVVAGNISTTLPLHVRCVH
jgi:Protein of unknown function (DUF1566)